MAQNNGQGPDQKPPESTVKMLQLVYDPVSGAFQVAGNAQVNQVMAYGMLELAKMEIARAHSAAAESPIKGAQPGELPADFRG